MEGLVLKSRDQNNDDRAVEAPRGGAGIEIITVGAVVTLFMKPLVEGLVLKSYTSA